MNAKTKPSLVFMGAPSRSRAVGRYLKRGRERVINFRKAL